MSNFYRSPYVINTQELLDEFCSAPSIEGTVKELCGSQICINWSEQGFMLVKCLVFLEGNSSNISLFEEILKAESPKDAKELGRKVHGYNDQVWASVREQAMFFNLIRKFNQNPDLKSKLLATGDAVLVEASPYDSIWGIGMRESDPLISDPFRWKGLNLLGKCLEDVRRHLANQ